MVPDVGRHLAGLGDRDDWTDEDDSVFAEDDGGWLNDDKLRLRYRTAQHTAGLRRLRFHDLCHSFGSLAIVSSNFLVMRSSISAARFNSTG